MLAPVAVGAGRRVTTAHIIEGRTVRGFNAMGHWKHPPINAGWAGVGEGISHE